MTAVNVIIRHDAVHVLTYIMMRDENVQPVGFIAKAFALPHLNAVIATRGLFDVLPAFALVLCGEAQDFEGLVAALRV